MDGNHEFSLAYVFQVLPVGLSAEDSQDRVYGYLEW